MAVSGVWLTYPGLPPRASEVAVIRIGIAYLPVLTSH